MQLVHRRQARLEARDLRFQRRDRHIRRLLCRVSSDESLPPPRRPGVRDRPTTRRTVPRPVVFTDRIRTPGVRTWAITAYYICSCHNMRILSH